MVCRERLVCPLPGDRAFASGSSPPTLNGEKTVGGEKQKPRRKALPSKDRGQGVQRGRAHRSGSVSSKALVSWSSQG